MAETLVIEKSRPTIVDIFVGLAVVISAFLFPVVMFGVLLLCIVVAGVGGKRYGNFFVGLVMVWFTWRFPNGRTGCAADQSYYCGWKGRRA